MATDCEHSETITSDERCFAGPVSLDENRAAHGCITYVETCCICGASRRANANQGFREFADWSDPPPQIRVVSNLGGTVYRGWDRAAALAAAAQHHAGIIHTDGRRGPERFWRKDNGDLDTKVIGLDDC